MAIGFELNIFNDLVFNDGALELVTEADEIARNLKTRLKLMRGEFSLDTSYGLPYNLLLGSSVFNLAELETIVKQFILDTDGILSLTRFNVSFQKADARLLQIDFTVNTIYGRVIINDALDNGGTF